MKKICLVRFEPIRVTKSGKVSLLTGQFKKSIRSMGIVIPYQFPILTYIFIHSKEPNIKTNKTSITSFEYSTNTI